ncbi:MAG: glutamate 5-kinase [Candidatus Acidiferrales bacterium]
MEQVRQKQDRARARLFLEAKRIVVKLGTSTVTGENGELCYDRVEPIVHLIAELMHAGRQVILVSSGAVGLGRASLGLHPSRLEDLVVKQACAAVGQSLLMDAYRKLFSVWQLNVAQVLLTEDDFTVWRRHSNLRHTIEKLLQFGVVPIINENDTVSTAEIESLDAPARSAAFSDNDRLAALVMSGLEADVLVLLTNVDGFLRKKGAQPGIASRGDSTSEVIPIVDRITPELESFASGPSASGRGGMRTKLAAAEIAMSCGGMAVIANGRDPTTLKRLFAGERVGTTFLPAMRMKGKRRWIRFAANVAGRLTVDGGAKRAIAVSKASLLASGVLRVEGIFSTKDVVSIMDKDGREFARGIVECASESAVERAKKQGSPRSRIVVRRDNIVLLEGHDSRI